MRPLILNGALKMNTLPEFSFPLLFAEFLAMPTLSESPEVFLVILGAGRSALLRYGPLRKRKHSFLDVGEMLNF